MLMARHTSEESTAPAATLSLRNNVWVLRHSPGSPLAPLVHAIYGCGEHPIAHSPESPAAFVAMQISVALRAEVQIDASLLPAPSPPPPLLCASTGQR